MHESDRTEAYMAEDRKNMTEPARVFLDRWLASMGSALEQWRRSYLPADFPFDFTLDSLDALEPIVLARYPDQAAIDVEDNAEFTTGTGRYIGEVLLRVAPARWGYQDRGDNDGNPYNRTAVIRSNTPARFMVVMAPEFRLQLLVRDRERGILRKAAVRLLDACEEAGRAELPGTGGAGGTVPDWCAFFTPDEYNRFASEVDSALSCFGAEGQDIDAGYVSLAAGDPDPEVHDFDIVGLADQCRASDIEDWSDLCFSAIDGYSTAQPQRDWLTRVTFTQVEDRLEPWLADEPKLSFDAEPDYPDQPFSIRLEDGNYLHFLATVPELEGIPEITTFVPNSAVRAWDIPVEKLVQWGIQHT
ncbi:hypothetical protein OHB12_03675 [Nocardia sp. NBC_01730]|uniref:hypothetical protein n=1 Tax=Nocardia sp. NBC_01730 TaxID=2975998 RepID=UPI002E12DC04|nr:hypothetical protein OHB12_03675 [Nocardia sp. NBC_01730]